MALSHNPKIATNGLVACYDAANLKSYPGSGSIWYDISRKENHSTIVNGAVHNSNYFAFDGTNDTIDCGPVSQIGNTLTSLTVSIWIYPTSAATKLILENGTGHTTNTFYLAQENANYFTFEVFGTNYDVVYANYVYEINKWYNLVGTWQSGSRVNLYTNGILTNGTRDGAMQTTVINGNTDMYVGSRAGSSFFFAGRLNLPMLYTRALSAGEIIQNFNSFKGRYI